MMVSKMNYPKMAVFQVSKIDPAIYIYIYSHILVYPKVKVYIAIEKTLVNQLFQWSLSIAVLVVYQRVCIHVYIYNDG